jgi:uncharacterized protein YecA (UPF0149 family)
MLLVKSKRIQDAKQETMKSWCEVTKDCLEKREANTGEIEAIAEHQEIPNEEAAVETTGALED